MTHEAEAPRPDALDPSHDTEHSGSTRGHHHSHSTGNSHNHSHVSNTLRESLHALSSERADGSRQINQYHILHPIGQGAYGIVHLGQIRDEADHFVAIKEFGKMRLRRNLCVSQHRRLRIPRKVMETMMDAETDPLFLVRTEVAIMKKLHHPNVIQLYEVLDDPDSETLYMVFEYCSDGTVFDVKAGEQNKPLSEETALKYFGQVLSGIDYLHEHGIVHRDIKPENILLTDNKQKCKIVDFGVSKMFVKPGDDTVKREAGSPAFMSPALCKGGGPRETHGCPDDVWAFGATLYCMVTGRLPFFKEGLLDLYESIQHDPLVLDDHLSPECRDLLSRMLDKNEETRITIREIYDHPWVKRPGAAPIPTLAEIEKNMVEEITEEDMQCAICRISNVFAVARAVSKFKRHSTVRSESDPPSDSSSNPANRREGSINIPGRGTFNPWAHGQNRSFDSETVDQSGSQVLGIDESLRESPTQQSPEDLPSVSKSPNSFVNSSHGPPGSCNNPSTSPSPVSSASVNDKRKFASPIAIPDRAQNESEGVLCTSPSEQANVISSSPSS